MKECGQPRSQGSFSSWNAAGGIRLFRSKKGPEAELLPLLFLGSLMGTRRLVHVDYEQSLFFL